MGGSSTMSVSAGRVLPMPKGTYDASVTYNMLDMVYYSGSTYVCKAQTTGHAPTDTDYWQIMAQGTQSAQIAGNYYGTCDTASATSNKVVTVPASENFVLQLGDIVGVRFTNTNTANNPTLNVNNSGAKPIYYNDDAVHTTYLWAGGEADRDTLFMYDGTNWVWIAHDVDLDTDALADLTDTNVSSPTNGQALLYNSTSQKWENGDITSKLADLTDTNISSVANKDILQYNSTSGKWENKALYKKLTATLTAGQTTLTFTDSSIVATSLVKLFSAEELDYESATSAVGSVTFTFEAQASDVTFTLLVMNI